MTKTVKKQKVVETPKVMLVMPKGDPVHGNHQKDIPARIILRFVADSLNGKFYEGNDTMVAIVPEIEGNLRWSIDKVYRYCDIFCSNDPSKAQTIADMMTDKFKEAGGKFGDIGISLAKWEIVDRLNSPLDIIPLE